MAERRKVILVCDRHDDDTLAAGSVEVVVDGDRRRLDLCDKHLAEWRKVMAPWLQAGRTTGRATRGPASGPARRPRRSPDAKQIREWAAANKMDIPARGRIPQSVHDAYRAAKAGGAKAGGAKVGGAKAAKGK